jgi:hypothetical protein
MRRSLVIYDFAPDPSEFPNTVYEENFILFFISVMSFFSLDPKNHRSNDDLILASLIIFEFQSRRKQ